MQITMSIKKISQYPKNNMFLLLDCKMVKASPIPFTCGSTWSLAQDMNGKMFQFAGFYTKKSYQLYAVVLVLSSLAKALPNMMWENRQLGETRDDVEGQRLKDILLTYQDWQMWREFIEYQAPRWTMRGDESC